MMNLLRRERLVEDLDPVVLKAGDARYRCRRESSTFISNPINHPLQWRILSARTARQVACGMG